MKEFSITFAPERPITGKKLRHAIDDYHHFPPGTTKKIKLKHLEEPADDMRDVDDDSTRFHLGTVVFKVFGRVEHKGEVTFNVFSDAKVPEVNVSHRHRGCFNTFQLVHS